MKLILSETQLKTLKHYINENSDYDVLVKMLLDDLNNNYKRAIETYRDGFEYKQRVCFEVIIDGELITPNDLVNYMINKYSLGREFIKQIIDDWANKRIFGTKLSKNIPHNI
jgi:hypothetical protein